MEEQVEVVARKSRRARKAWTAEERERIVAESRRPGVSVNEVAQSHGLNPSLLSSWRGKAGSRPKPGRAEFLPVRVSDRADGVIEIDVASRCVRVRGRVDGATLRDVLAAVQ